MPPRLPADCIHYCNPGVPQNWIAQLALALSVHVKPLDAGAAILDKRCLWGTERTFDTNEQGFV